MITTTNQPVQTSERILALDFLRGFAILGILIMNIQSFSMPGAAYMNPMAYGDLSGANKWVWILSHIFADQKFMTIFSILFGAGIIMMTQKAMERTGKSAGLHYRRTFWLLLIGLLHAHIIWYGDILVPYALCALFVYLFRNARPTTLLIVGILFVSAHTLLYWFFGTTMEHWPAEGLEQAKLSWVPGLETMQAEIAAVTGSLSEQIGHNSASATFLETFVFLSIFLWRAGGLMLIGMGLYKWGVLTGKRSKRFYSRGLILGFLIGIPIILYGLYRNFNADFSFEYSMYIGSQYNYWGSLFVAYAFICLVMLIARSRVFPWLKDRLAAVGQMALTNYIMQSVICILIFYGIGFGLFGTVDRMGQIGIVLGVWILQIAWSRPWLKKFRFGPLEWLWRSLTYMKIQPFRKK